MSLNMSEKQAREFFASIGRPYPGDVPAAAPAEPVQPVAPARRTVRKVEQPAKPRAPRAQAVKPARPVAKQRQGGIAQAIQRAFYSAMWAIACAGILLGAVAYAYTWVMS